ncbi:hypothetical protein GCM10023230_25790 [Flavobacterium hankyongi]|uniref:Uncharacterized protein n=2 Tax=Flavobacteriaceae TaxID=49546 RepID=A0ABP9A5T3_9FLAO
MDKIFKFFFILLTSSVMFSQSSKSNLNDIYNSYLKSDSKKENKEGVDFLVKQYYILEKIEKDGLALLKTNADSEIQNLESDTYLFWENVMNFEKVFPDFEKNIQKEKLNTFLYVTGQLKESYEIFARFLNNTAKRKEYFDEFKLKKDTVKDLLIDLLRDF